MKLKKKLAKIKDKYFLYAYGIVLIAGIVYILIAVQDIKSSWDVRLDVFARFSLFLVNITAPFIIWQHFLSRILINNQRIIDSRKYIWKSRAVIFRQRKNFFIIHLIFSLALAVFSLKTFGKSFFDETILLSVIAIATIVFIATQLFSYSRKFIRNTNKNMKNHKIHSSIYIQSLKDEDTVRQMEKSQIEENLENQISIIVENDDYFDLTTVQTIYNECNNSIFIVTDINAFYNILNVKSKSVFQIKVKGRFLSLIYLLESIVENNPEWDKEILQIFEIDYTNDYMRNRKKYIDDNIYFDHKMDLLDKIRHIIDTKG